MKKKLVVKGEFTFHGVGQGLFYSGYLSNANFNFVYDCGTKKVHYEYLTRKINFYLQNLKGKTIDLITISHLDKDHMNGINQILTRAKVRIAVLPYLSPIKRLLLAIRNLGAPFWYFSFLSNPITYLLDNGVDRIVIIGGEGGTSASDRMKPILFDGDKEGLVEKLGTATIYRLRGSKFFEIFLIDIQTTFSVFLLIEVRQRRVGGRNPGFSYLFLATIDLAFLRKVFADSNVISAPSFENFP